MRAALAVMGAQRHPGSFPRAASRTRAYWDGWAEAELARVPHFRWSSLCPKCMAQTAYLEAHKVKLARTLHALADPRARLKRRARELF